MLSTPLNHKKDGLFQALKWTIFFLILGFFSCKKNEVVPMADQDFPEYVVFGQAFSPMNCSGSEGCIEIFKLESGKLSEDVADFFPEPGVSYPGDFSNALSRDDYEQVLDLLDQQIPQTLLNLESGLLYTNSSGFASYIYFEYKSPKLHKYWVLNNGELGLLPTDVQQFVAKLQSAINVASF
jgi:hypothetical protein